MLVIAFGVFLLLPLVLLTASLGRTALGMSRGATAAAAVAADTPVLTAVALDEAPVFEELAAADEAPAAPRRKRFARRRRGERNDFFGDAAISSRLRDHASTRRPAAVPTAAATVSETVVAEAPTAPRPVVIPAPAPVFARTASDHVAAAVARPIAPAGAAASARLVLR